MKRVACATVEAERGMTSISFVVAAGLSLVLFVSMANVVVMVFERGAIRAAVDEAVRVGGRSDTPVADCEARARAVLDGLLGPAARSGVQVRCTLGGDPPMVRAHAEAALAPWLPAVPSWSLELDATSGLEVLP